jgi:hypothetical protein
MVATSRDVVTRPLVILLLVPLTGCLFYSDPINQRPSARIDQASPSVPLYRSSDVTLDADGNDPEGGAITWSWRAYACTDGTDPTGCDQAPFKESSASELAFTIPDNRVDGAQLPTQSLRVVLEGEDDDNAITKPDPVLVLPVGDQAPQVDVTASARDGFVDQVPVALYARYTDADDAAAALTVAWTIFPPADNPNATWTLTPATRPIDPDPSYLQAAQTLLPDGTGNWTARATVTDPLGQATMTDTVVAIGSDEPPCIAAVAPIAAPSGEALPMSAVTLFEAVDVTDDLDRYPPVPGDPVLGATTFSWSIEPPGTTSLQPLAGVTGNSFALDPADYTPGDVITLRVEVGDRAHAVSSILCDPADPICDAVPSCTQRETWRVEVR